jgi:hypothetical protein
MAAVVVRNGDEEPRGVTRDVEVKHFSPLLLFLGCRRGASNRTN